MPFDDFDINAAGTLNLLEAARRSCPQAPFVFLSSNKVYGDNPNRIRLREHPTRWDFEDPAYADGIPESLSVDRCMHSLFGTSKLAADVLVQEYGRRFGLPTCCLRCGCVTGPRHAGVELHGFLSYLVRSHVRGVPYRVFGHQGKQVRDNIHARDLARFVTRFFEAPRVAEVYNLGGGKANTCSVREALSLVAQATGTPQRVSYLDEARPGDHLCYYSDLRRAREHYPGWDIEFDLPHIIAVLVEQAAAELARSDAAP